MNTDTPRGHYTRPMAAMILGATSLVISMDPVAQSLAKADAERARREQERRRKPLPPAPPAPVVGANRAEKREKGQRGSRPTRKGRR
jgi:hypothetical protein